MKKKSKSEITPIDMGNQDETARVERNVFQYFYQLDQRMESVERTLNKLSHHVASLEDALSHVTQIPNLPLELIYDHSKNTLWAETRRKLEFKKNEAALISLMFVKSTGKPKKRIFQCSEEAKNLRKSGEGIESAQNVFDTAKRVQKKLDEFLHTHKAMVVTKKSFYFSKIAHM